MIINGGSRCNARFFAKHLTDGETNERVTLCDIRNLASQNVADALHEMEVVALGTFCKNFFYHANINPLDTEQLTPGQWEQAVDTLEKNLGLIDHARFVVEHHKKSRTHRHVIWSRINVLRMRAVKMTDDYAKHQATARHLEQEFGLEPGESVLGPDKVKGSRPKRRPKAWETFRGQKTGIDPAVMTEQITALYHASASGREFADRLSKRNYTLVKADRRDFCIRDAAGQLHSLARRLDGITALQCRAFMSDVDPASLPGITKATPHKH
jgi:hypothetical protein